MSFQRVIFFIAANVQISIVNGIICLERPVAPSNDGCRGVNAKVVRVFEKEWLQDFVIIDRNGSKIHGFEFINMGIQEGIFRKPERRYKLSEPGSAMSPIQRSPSA